MRRRCEVLLLIAITTAFLDVRAVWCAPAGKSVHAVARQDLDEVVTHEIRSGEARLAEREFEKALFHFKRALKENPKSALALLGRGDVYRLSHDFSRAVTYYRELIRLRPDLSLGYAYTAMTLVAQGKLKDAEEEIERYEKKSGSRALSRYLRGVIAQRRGIADEAVGHYQAALEAEPAFVDVYTDYGLLRAEQGKSDDALRLYRKAQELDPKSSEVLRRIGDVLHSRGNVPGSIAAYEKAIELGPANAGAHANLAGNYLMEGRYSEASITAERAIELDENLIEPHYTLGMSYAELEMIPAARGALRRFLELAGEQDMYRELKARAKAKISSLGPDPVRFRAGSEQHNYHREIYEAAAARGISRDALAEVLGTVEDNTRGLSTEQRDQAFRDLLEALRH